jgi:hypothetical protein
VLEISFMLRFVKKPWDTMIHSRCFKDRSLLLRAGGGSSWNLSSVCPLNIDEMSIIHAWLREDALPFPLMSSSDGDGDESDGMGWIMT